MIRTPGYTWKKTVTAHSEPTHRMYRGRERIATVGHNFEQNIWTWRSERYPSLVQSIAYVAADEAKIACAAAHDTAGESTT